MERRTLLKYGVAGSLGGFLTKLTFVQECDPTTADIEGPFYTPNAPVRNNLLPEGAKGERLFLTGTVYANDCTTPMPNVELDVWQADKDGAYDNQGFNYRGKFNTDNMGNYSMETVLPGKYLNGAQFRPRHIHFKVRSQGTTVTTQLYFEGDDSIPIDPWASNPAAEGRIIPLVPDQQDILHGVFDVYLDLDPTTASTELQRQQETRISAITPNPLSQEGNITIIQHSPAKLTLHLRDIRGSLIKEIEIGSSFVPEQKIPIDARTSNGLKIPSGIYILQLLRDGQLWDAKRVVIL